MDVEKAIETVSGKDSLKQQKNPRDKDVICVQLPDFAYNTTLQGPKNIRRRQRTRVERTLRTALILLSIGVCLYQIHNVWVKWQNKPVMVTISERLVPVTEVAFPSVTICPQWKVLKPDFNFPDELKTLMPTKHNDTSHLSLAERMQIEDVVQICNIDIDDLEYLSYLDRNYSDASVVENIFMASQGRTNSIFTKYMCYWRNQRKILEEIFNRVLTKEGFCYNFNALPQDQILRLDNLQTDYSYIDEYGYQIPESEHRNRSSAVDIERGRPNSYSADLKITFVVNKSAIYLQCNPFSSGYKVYLHDPADMPHASLYYYALTPEHTTSLAVKYNVMTASDQLRQYSPQKRQCYFSGERYLRYFKTYTESNCRMECLTNYTYKQCGCVGFYMPHHRSDRICTIQRFSCMANVESGMAKSEAMESPLKDQNCNCLPACESVEYEAEVLKSDLAAQQYLASQGVDAYANFRNCTFMALEMYFKSPRAVAMHRSELFGLTDFIADCGGLLGLFLGLSVLSLAETIYSFICRCWCTPKRDLDNDIEPE